MTKNLTFTEKPYMKQKNDLGPAFPSSIYQPPTPYRLDIADFPYPLSLSLYKHLSYFSEKT